MNERVRQPGRATPLEVALELTLQRAGRQLGAAASIAEDLGRYGLVNDLQDTKYFVQTCLREVQERKRHARIAGQLALELPTAARVTPPPEEIK